jgi:hypothetical protein
MKSALVFGPNIAERKAPIGSSHAGFLNNHLRREPSADAAL